MDTYNEPPDYFDKDLGLNKEKTSEEIQADRIENLEALLKSETERLLYKIWQLRRLAVIEQYLSVFGTLDYELAKEKNEILNQYL